MKSKNLVYLASPGNVAKSFEKIKSAPTPQRVTRDFVKTTLGIKGGPGDALASFLKKIGFVNADATPSPHYLSFRNPATSGAAVAEAFKIAYAPLYEHHEFVHELDDQELKGLIIQVTGCAEDARSLALTLSTIRALKDYADFSEPGGRREPDPDLGQSQLDSPIVPPHAPHGPDDSVGLNLSYTINLNLPATADIAVFDAIFKSLRQNLLKQ